MDQPRESERAQIDQSVFFLNLVKELDDESEIIPFELRLQHIIDFLRRKLDVDLVRLYVLEHTCQTCTCVGEAKSSSLEGIKPAYEGSVPLAGTVFDLIASEKEPLMYDADCNCAGLLLEGDDEEMAKIHRQAIFPLQTKHDCLCAIHLATTKSDEMSELTRHILEFFKMRISNAILSGRHLDALHDSRERFRFLLHHLPVAVVSMTPDEKGGVISQANEAFRGITSGDEQGIEKLVFDIKQKLVEQQDQGPEMSEQEQKDIGEGEFEHVDGRSFQVKSYRQPDGSVVIILTDISQFKTMESTLRNTIAKYEALLKLMPCMMFEITTDGKYVTIHGSAGELIGPREDLIGTSIAQGPFQPGEMAKIMAAIIEAVTSKEVQTVSYAVPTVGDPLRKTHFKAQLLPLPNGNVLSCVWNTESENTVKQLGAEYERIADCIPHPLCIVDVKSKGIKYANTALRNIFPGEELKDTQLGDVVPRKQNGIAPTCHAASNIAVPILYEGSICNIVICGTRSATSCLGVKQ